MEMILSQSQSTMLVSKSMCHVPFFYNLRFISSHLKIKGEYDTKNCLVKFKTIPLAFHVQTTLGLSSIALDSPKKL